MHESTAALAIRLRKHKPAAAFQGDLAYFVPEQVRPGSPLKQLQQSLGCVTTEIKNTELLVDG